MTLVYAPRTDTDAAVTHIDNGFDPGWIDREVTQHVWHDLGVSRVFVFGDWDNLLYAAADGHRAALAAYDPFMPTASQLIPHLRAREARRSRLKLVSTPGAVQTMPISESAFGVADGQLYIVTAMLVQPDFGTVLPDTPQAPVVIMALPVNAGWLRFFSERYLIHDMALSYGDRVPASRASVALTSPQGRRVATLMWTPRTPGFELLGKLVLPLLAFGIVFGLLAWRFIQQSANIASDLIASEAHARHLAFHDTLTQMPNRALMFDRLRGMLAQSRRSGQMVAVHCLDLDRFKEVNDTLGHQAGDELIQKVCQRLIGLCREGDTVARLGGDEFVILQPHTDASGASHLAERVLKSFKEPYELAFGTVEVGCSIGVTLVENPDIDANEALRQADMSLYGSKDAGRNRVTFFEPEMDAALRMRRNLETDLRHALAHDGLSVVYQPQIDNHGGMASVEALVRWDHPEKGAIPPTAFIALAEESGLIIDLGEFVFRRVFQETAGWQDVRVAINVSALQLRSMNFMSMLTRLVAEHRIDASHYEIEITETALLGDDNVTRDNITVLKQEGFTIALDDFGTGYSSLSSLQRFAVDKIKIDRSFIRNLEADEEAEALVEAIIKLARALKLNIVAEGVETESQRDRLLHCGCNHFQGYLLSRPVSATEIERLQLV